jgi:hypothetical protein
VFLDDLAVDRGEVQALVVGDFGVDAADGGPRVLTSLEEIAAEAFALVGARFKEPREVDVPVALESLVLLVGHQRAHERVRLLRGQRRRLDGAEVAADPVGGRDEGLDVQIGRLHDGHRGEEFLE